MMDDSINLQFYWIENCIYCNCGNVIFSFYESALSWVSMQWWCKISWYSSEIYSVIILVGEVLCFFWDVDLWFDWFHPQNQGYGQGQGQDQGWGQGYCWTFSHNTEVPISINQNKYFLSLNTYTILFAWGDSNQNKNIT